MVIQLPATNGVVFFKVMQQAYLCIILHGSLRVAAVVVKAAVDPSMF